MRAMLAAAFLVAGCLHAQGPVKSVAKTDAATLRAFEILVNDNTKIREAAEFAEANGIRREEWIGIVERAYWSFMRATVYPPAAEIASRFGFGRSGIMPPLLAQRGDAAKAIDAYIVRKKEKDGRAKLYAAIWELTLEARISCRYGPTVDEAKKTVESAELLKALSGSEDALYFLLDEGCPVDDVLRTSIIDTALLEDKDEYAIRHGSKAGWDGVKRSQFIWHFFSYADCTDGMKALEAFGVSVDEGVGFVEGSICEHEIIDSSGWKLSREAAERYFFAAVRRSKFNLALELLPLGTLGDDGRTFLYQEAMRAGRESELVDVLNRHLSYHDPFMAYAWDRGRYRFIANFSLTLDWQRKAFDKLIELKQWDFAAEAAQYGISEAFRTEGVLIAFRAAMADGDFKSGRYFVARYGPTKTKPGLVTREMYEKERDKWYASKGAGQDPKWMKESASEAKRKVKKKKKRKRAKPCPEDDWCP